MNLAKVFLVATFLGISTFSLASIDREKAYQQFQQGLTAVKRGDYQNAFKIWLPLAKSGVMEAQVNLGHMYIRGDGVKKDYAEAAKWYKKAAEQGYAEAQFNLRETAKG